jgi:hypothetical protein
VQTSSLSTREKRIIRLASSINELMRKHKDRNEAIDAYDMARVLFRRGTGEKAIIRRSSLALPTAP